MNVHVLHVTFGPRSRWQRWLWWLPSKAWLDGGWRWRVAQLMDKLPGQCWADLVTWVQDGTQEAVERADSWRGALPYSSNKGCGPGSPDYERNGCCYCGKLRTPEVDAQMRAAGAPRGTVR